MKKRIFTKESFVVEITVEKDGALFNVETILGDFRARFTLPCEAVIELAAMLEIAASDDFDAMVADTKAINDEFQHTESDGLDDE